MDWIVDLLPTGAAVGNAVWLLATFLLLLLVVPLAALGLPGSWLLLIWCVGTYVAGGSAVSLWWLIAGLAVAVAGEVVEQVLGIAATKKGGGGKFGMWGAAIGSLVAGIVGLFVPPPVVGAILVAMLGAFIGAFAGEAWFAARGYAVCFLPYVRARGSTIPSWTGSNSIDG